MKRQDFHAKKTSKHFFSAFGQPGVVICLEDLGKSYLKILQEAARAVEAKERGTVEEHLWGNYCLSMFAWDKSWLHLAQIKDRKVVNSQLDVLPRTFYPSNDIVSVLADVISVEVSKQFESQIKKSLKELAELVEELKAGPPKTRARSFAKSQEYKLEFTEEPDNPRAANFRKKFYEVFGREPVHDHDWVWNVLDFARCSVILNGAKELLKIKEKLEHDFEVVSVKNTFKKGHKVKGSGYRDLKLLVKANFEDLELKDLIPMPLGATHGHSRLTMICEIQLVCSEWLSNKKNTSFSYKILRASSLKGLFGDTAKYLTKSKKFIDSNELTIENTLRLGHANYARPLLKKLDEDLKSKTLINVCEGGWGEDSVDESVKALAEEGCNLEAVDDQGWTALMFASQNGHDKVVNALIYAKCNLDSTNAYGRNALMYASERGYSNVVKYLVTAKCELNAQHVYDKTALMYAAEGGHVKVVRRLVKAHANLNLKNYYGRTALTYAQKLGHDDVAKMLQVMCGTLLAVEDDEIEHRFKSRQKSFVESKRNDVYLTAEVLADPSLLADFMDHRLLVRDLPANVADRSIVLQLRWLGGNMNVPGLTSLLKSSEEGDARLATALIDARCDLEKKDKMGFSSLMHAAKNGHEEIVRALVDAKCNLNAANVIGHTTALMYAADQAYHKVVQILVDAGCDVEARKIEEMVTSEKQRDPSVLDNIGKTALMIASEKGCDKVVEILVDRGANIEAHDEPLRYTSLMLASRNGHPAVVRILAQAKAILEKKNADGVTALMLASMEGHFPVVSALFDAGITLEARDKVKKTALSHACERGADQVVRMLVNAGAFIEAKSRNGYTPLILATKKRHEMIVIFLVESGCKLQTSDNFGITALMHAEREGFSGIVNLLKEALRPKKKDRPKRVSDSDPAGIVTTKRQFSGTSKLQLISQQREKPKEHTD